MANNVTQTYGASRFPNMDICAKSGTAEVGGARRPTPGSPASSGGGDALRLCGAGGKRRRRVLCGGQRGRQGSGCHRQRILIRKREQDERQEKGSAVSDQETDEQRSYRHGIGIRAVPGPAGDGAGAAGGLGGRCLRRGGNFQLPLRAGGAAQGQGEYLLQSAVGTAGADHLPGGLRGAGRQAAAGAVKQKNGGIRWIPAAFSYSETVSSSKVRGTSTGAGAPSGSSWRLTFSWPTGNRSVDAEGNSPADGIGPVERLDGVELGELENGGDPQQPQAAGAHQGHQHGHDGVADAAQAAHHHVHHAAEGIGGADDAHPHQSGLNDRGTGGVDGQQYPTCQRGGVAQHQPHHQYAALGADHDLADAVVVTGAVVLAGEGNGGLVHGVHRHVYELLNVGRSGVAGHDDLTEGIDGGLDHHVGQGEENPLESGGQADAEDLPHGLGVEPHLLEIQVQRAGILHHAAEHQGGGDALGRSRWRWPHLPRPACRR